MSVLRRLSTRGLQSSARALGSSSSSSSVRPSSAGDVKGKQPLHPEEWLQLARNWPKEEFYPGNYKTSSPADYTPWAPNGGHDSPHPNGQDTHAFRATYSTPFTTGLLGFGLLGALAWKIGDSYAEEDSKEHPVTRWIGSYLGPIRQELGAKEDERVIPLNQQLANERLLFEEERFQRQNQVYRARFTGMLDRASDRFIVPGTQRDLSSVQWKHSWEKDDDLLPPKEES